MQIKIKFINIKNIGRMPEHQYKVHSKRRDGGGWRGEQIIARSWALPCNITRQRGHSYWQVIIKRVKLYRPSGCSENIAPSLKMHKYVQFSLIPIVMKFRILAITFGVQKLKNRIGRFLRTPCIPSYSLLNFTKDDKNKNGAEFYSDFLF